MTRARIQEQLLFGAGYTSFFLFMFLVFSYLTFPYERLRGLIEGQLGSEQTVHIGDIGPAFLTGIALHDVKLTRAVSANEAEPASIQVDKIVLHASPLALAFGKRAGDVSISVGDGSIDASYEQEADSQHIEAELSDVDFKELGLGPWLGVPLKGKASGKLDLTLATEAAKSLIDIDLEVDGLHLGDGKSKVKLPGMSAGMTIDEIDAGKLQLVVKASEGSGTIDKLSTNGHDLKVTSNGTLALGQTLARTRVDMLMELKFSDAYKNKSEKTKTMFELLSMQGDFRRATSADGALKLHITGSPQALRALPSSIGPAARAGKKPRKAPTAPAMP